jgi:hypothetical protein
MPELLGFEDNKAIVDFPKARKFILGQGHVPNPHRKEMGISDLEQIIDTANSHNQDPSFFETTLKELEAHINAQSVTSEMKTEAPKPQTKKNDISGPSNP